MTNQRSNYKNEAFLEIRLYAIPQPLNSKKEIFVGINIEVELSPVFQTVSGASLVSVGLEEDEVTVRGLLLRLAKRYGERMRNLLFERGEESILSGLMVMFNGRIYTGAALNKEPVPLMDGDKVSLLYFVSGG